MEGEYDFLNEVAKVLVIVSSHIANPLVSVGISLLAHREGKGPVDVGEDHLLLVCFHLELLPHVHSAAIIKIYIKLI